MTELKYTACGQCAFCGESLTMNHTCPESELDKINRAAKNSVFKTKKQVLVRFLERDNKAVDDYNYEIKTYGYTLEKEIEFLRGRLEDVTVLVIMLLEDKFKGD